MYPTKELNEMENKETPVNQNSNETPTIKTNNAFRPHNQSRKCTDIFCTIIFIIFCLGEVAIVIVAHVFGNPLLLLYPRDSQGDLCGYHYPTKPHLLYFDIVECARMGASVFVTGCRSPQVCVEKCPTAYSTYLTSVAIESIFGMKILNYSKSC